MALVFLEAQVVADAQTESRLGRAVGFAVRVEAESTTAVGPKPGRLVIDESKFKVGGGPL